MDESTTDADAMRRFDEMFRERAAELQNALERANELLLLVGMRFTLSMAPVGGGR